MSVRKQESSDNLPEGEQGPEVEVLYFTICPFKMF